MPALSAVILQPALVKDFYGIKLNSMIALFLVLAVSLLVASFFLGGLLWSIRKDQFDDQAGCALRMLHDEEPDPLRSAGSH